MKRIVIKIVVLACFFVVFPAHNMTRWGSLKNKIFSGRQKPISLMPINQSNVFETKKTLTQNILEKYPSLTYLSNTYQKMEDRLQYLPISPSFLSRMAFTFMTGIPTFFIDLPAWASWGKKLFAHMSAKKLSFNQVYQKNPFRLEESNKDELLIRLEKLANLSVAEKEIKQNSYQEEVELGEKAQAQAWFFGSMYRDAIHNAETIDDIALLYESASMWLRLRIESGLYDDAHSLETELDRVDQHVEKILSKYDEQSIPTVKKYLQDLRQDYKDSFVQWFEGRQQVNVEE